MPILSEPLPKLNEKPLPEPRIGSMEIFQYERQFIQDHLPGVDPDWICGLFKVSCGGSNGWEEFRLPPTAARFDLIRYASVFRQLKGLPVQEAIDYVTSRGECWGTVRQRMAEAALLNLLRHLPNDSGLRLDGRSRLSSTERDWLFVCSQAYYSF